MDMNRKAFSTFLSAILFVGILSFSLLLLARSNMIGGSPNHSSSIRGDSTEVDGYTSERARFIYLESPVASFIFSPTEPFVNETVTFDASDSNDTDGKILSYMWDFGDGTGQTEVEPKTQHFYNATGFYNVSLTVTDDDGLNDTATRQVSVGKMPSIIVILADTAEIVIRENVTISGGIAPERPDASVTVWCRLESEDWISLANLTSGVNSEYQYNWVPSKTGTYALKASWIGDEYTLANESETIKLNCLNISSSISIETNSASTYIGYRVNVTGTLKDMYSIPLSNETVVLYYTFGGTNTWTLIAFDKTDSSGKYFTTWIPPAIDDFLVKAEWEGNATHTATDSIITLSALLHENRYVFTAESNSTVSNLAFDSQSRRLSFTATGPDGTVGRSKVTVAKSLLINIEDVEIRVDGVPYNYTVSDLDDSWALTFAYNHSSHEIGIELGDLPTPPNITLISPQNRSYNSTLTSLTFTVNETTSWTGYSLDGEENVTIAENTTLTISEGSHNIVVYANDTDGHIGASDIVHFVVDITPPEIVAVLRHPSGNVQPNQPVTISVNVSDSLSEVESVRLIYFTNRSSPGVESPMMLNQTSGLYESMILVTEADTLVKYEITAYDTAGNNVTDDNAGEYYVYVIIPEFPFYLFISLFMIALLLTALIHKRNKVCAR